MFIDQLDRCYTANQERLNIRQEEKDRAKVASSLPSTSVQTSEEFEFSFDLSNDESSNSGSEVNFDMNIGTENSNVQLALDTDAVRSVVASAVARNISSRDVLHVLAPFVQQNGGDLQRLSLSQSTIQRHKKKAAMAGSALHREKVFEAVANTDLPVIGLFDGKTIKEFTHGDHLKKERLGILCSIEGETYLLGIPAISSSAGEHQLIALTNIFEEFGIMEKIAGVVVDTTGSNTGPIKGSVSRLEKEKGEALLLLACRRHVNERHIFHFWENVTMAARTTSPSNPMFVKLLKNWNDIRANIDSNNLNKLELQAEDFLKEQAEAAISFYKKVLQDEVFDMDEYKEMAELGLMILDQTQAYKIYRPCEPNSARFLNSGLNYQKLFLLMNQFPNLVSKDELPEVNAMAEFSSIFYGVWFLSSSLASAAPANDIHSVWQMRQYSQQSSAKVSVAAKRVEKSILDHSWYMEEDLIPLSLLDKNLSDVDKEMLASALVATKVPDAFPPRNRKKLPQVTSKALI